MKERILIICPQESSSFVQHDAAILAERFEVEVLSLHRLRSPKVFWTFIEVGRKLRKKTSLVLMWFSVPHLAPVIVLLGKLFGTKLVAITGGFDVAYVPRIRWGEMGSRWKRSFQKFSLYRTDFVLPFSEFSARDTLRYAPADRVKTLYPGIDCGRFSPQGQKSNIVVTTCNVINRFTIVQKGLDVFARCAESLQEYQFTIVGLLDVNDMSAMKFLENAPSNLLFTREYVSDDELLSFYRAAKVYVQASAHEGFGIACAEAMACECVPVGTLDTSLPEVIGGTGFLVPYNDVPATIDAIRDAMASPELGAAARKRIVQNFSPETRTRELLTIIDQVLKK